MGLSRLSVPPAPLVNTWYCSKWGSGYLWVPRLQARRVRKGPTEARGACRSVSFLFVEQLWPADWQNFLPFPSSLEALTLTYH